MDSEGVGKTATYLSLVIPWVYYSYGTGYAVVFSFFSTNSFRNFTDIYSYTFEYTHGSFSSGFLFWHVSLILGVASAVLVSRRRYRIGSVLMVLGGVSVFRFSLAFADSVSYVVPFGSVWMFVTGVLLRQIRRTSKPS